MTTSNYTLVGPKNEVQVMACRCLDLGVGFTFRRHPRSHDLFELTCRDLKSSKLIRSRLQFEEWLNTEEPDLCS